MFEQIILGVIQGIAEWLPVSSEGLIVLASRWLLPNTSFEGLVNMALLLHFGTFLAALIYFRKEVLAILKTLVSWKKERQENKKLTLFLAASTVISGLFGLILLEILGEIFETSSIFAETLTLFVGILLLVTGGLIIFSKRNQLKTKSVGELSPFNSIVLGFTQGFAALPGLSRSGLTVSALLLSKFKEETSMRLSFLMSIPIVFFGNLIVNSGNKEIFTIPNLAGILFAFVFGLITIDLLMRLARKVNFGWFVVIFGLITILASFV